DYYCTSYAGSNTYIF
nr:immunoglobulin light chain junction region [Macaca mulatta]MOW56566.1 immunoglobulin light chain junction region [Macaca mulatta]MOW57686.1 immunoglobulin light chain junction region [Macaca mulatta]MOW58577.1 immunoglobulin light chain junction region [Macaca mulatta]